MKKLFWILFMGNIFGCGTDEKKEAYVLPGLDHGLIQSPINIITSDVTEAQHHIEPRYQPTHEEIIHKAYTVEVEYDSGS